MKKGQSLVEAALILAAFMGLLLSMVAVGATLFARETLVDRVHAAARWGALNRYDPQAIRNLVLYGDAAPAGDATPFLGLTPASVEVANPGCPGAACRISVSIPEHGVRSSEPVETTATASRVQTTP